MNDKEIVQELLAEGVATAIRERWVNPDDIQDDKLRMLVRLAAGTWDNFDFACYLIEYEAERIRNDAG